MSWKGGSRFHSRLCRYCKHYTSLHHFYDRLQASRIVVPAITDFRFMYIRVEAESYVTYCESSISIVNLCRSLRTSDGQGSVLIALDLWRL